MQTTGGIELHRLFSAFPEGLPGLGLLLLRLTVSGTIVFLIDLFYLELVMTTVRGWVIGVVSLVASAMMILGFLTPVISGLIFIGGALFLILSPREMTSFLAVYLVVLSFAAILLGPGAYSIDARLFGLREIIISKKDH